MATILIDEVTKIADGAIVLGRVEIGTIRKGMKAHIAGKSLSINAISNENQEEAYEGDKIGIHVVLEERDEGIWKSIASHARREYDMLLPYKGRNLEFY